MNILTTHTHHIQDLIYTIRGQQVMLDSDLAVLYQVQTKVLNQAVKRNIDRFPEDFMFQLDQNDIDLVRSQIVTSPESNLFQGQDGGRRYKPYVFTQEGIAMLSSILRSKIAAEVSISIMRTFVEMRKFLITNQALFTRLDEVEHKQLEYQKSTDEKFEQVFDYIAANKEVLQKVFFNGQIYDAFTLLIELVKQANTKIILIDNYVDTGTLNILSKRKDSVSIEIYTLPRTQLTQHDIDTFNAQYTGLTVKNIQTFHDRFMILDDSICYHIGASIKDAGKKSFAISKIEDQQVVMDILTRL